MYLGIEIGGTKLQLAVAAEGAGRLDDLVRLDVAPDLGAERIRQRIAAAGRRLIAEHPVEAIGVGFGGPVDAAAGRSITSHQVAGWENFPLVQWCQETLGPPTVLVNDSDAAGLAEARFGAGQGSRVVFYSNVGSGIGGALVIDGTLYPGGGGVAAELGHLRPGLDCRSARQTVESLASGWGMADAARRQVAQNPQTSAAIDLLRRCEGAPRRLTAKILAEAAEEGNALAASAFHHACQVYGWALAQMITLLAPNVVVLGGGVSLVGEKRFLDPLRAHVDRYVFPPLRESFALRLAALGEQVVLHGAIALAAAAR
ncbi:MAG: ROK family protein [Thermoguttaceae bacterium]|jgi:glucokinase|nr:ROK family protein [Thermoguttaceae bacterium]MDI9443672.1 ROK family protein [Planctomycetota bacterium]